MKDPLFFTKAFQQLTQEELENYHKAVIMNMDGEKGENIRRDYYKTKLKHQGDNVKIGRNVKMVCPENIFIGDNVTIDDDCVLIACSVKGITLEDGVTLKHQVYLDIESKESGYIHIKENVYVGTRCTFHGHAGLEIGEETLIAQNVTITPYSHKFQDETKLIFEQGGHTRKITIGRDCYIGMSCTILYSADINAGSVIGSGSVVVHTIPTYSVAVGVPARVIKKRGKDD